MKCVDLFNSADLAEFLSEEEKEIIIDNSTLITYRKGESLVKKGEYVVNAIFIKSGYVKVHLEFSRKSIIFNIVGPRRFILLDYMISDDIQPFNITAVEETSVCLIDINIIRQLVQNNSRFSFYLLQNMNKNVLTYITHNLVSLTQNNIHGRLAHVLLFLSEKVYQSSSFNMLLSRKELADFCNISRENVIKLLYEFADDGLIQVNGKIIHISSIENLRKIANHG